MNKQNVNRYIRRTHMYLPLFLTPWMFVYALSTWMLNHGPYFRQFRPGPNGWTKLWEKDYAVKLPPTQAELRALAGTILKENGFDHRA